MSEWLVDRVKRKSMAEFSEEDFAELGKHHGDAIVARLVTSELPEIDYIDYIEAVMAGLRALYSQDKSYYKATHDRVFAFQIRLMESDKRLGNFRYGKHRYG